MSSGSSHLERSTIAPLDSLCLSSIDWSEGWQGQQEIMSRLARRGSRVVYVENTAARSPRVTDLPRLVARLKRSTGAPHSGDVPRGIEILSPVAAPFPWSRWARPLNRVLVARRVAAQASRLRDPMVIWTFLPTPTVVDAVRASLRPTCTVIYYCVSDFSAVVDDQDALRAAEDELLSLADLVFVNGQTLRSRFVKRHPRVRVYPFGADLERFDPRRQPPEPADLASIPRPRVGYVGGMHRHLAIDWLAAAARALPRVSFVLVGPAQPDTDLAELMERPNVHVLGARPHALLPGYISGFDACLIPYASSRYTESVVPTKLFEYLAMDRRVVSSDLPELRALLPARSPVILAGSAEHFVQAVRRVLSDPADASVQELGRAIARRYSWVELQKSMINDIATVRGGMRERDQLEAPTSERR